jgi:hypothetical protein
MTSNGWPSTAKIPSVDRQSANMYFAVYSFLFSTINFYDNLVFLGGSLWKFLQNSVKVCISKAQCSFVETRYIVVTNRYPFKFDK